MIELPEALIIARQMDKELAGKRIVHGDRGNSPHKFAFSSGTSEEYAAIFKGKTIGRSSSHGMATCTEIGSDHTLVLGGGGERILLHPQDAKLPKKYQLLLQFEDGTSLTVTVSGWGNTLLLPQETAGQHRHVREDRIVPLSDAFTWDHFRGLFRDAGESTKSVKYFVISEPGIHGIGNGCLQDILFRAKIHPRRRVVDIAEDEQRALYDAINDTLNQIVDLGGRSSETDLYGNKGGYMRILDSKTKGTPCPECGTAIEKIQYLGGACYLCPTCQT
jgi:formamidopyrimidine-DNA glycosylase